jgi:hypothetical protein
MKMNLRETMISRRWAAWFKTFSFSRIARLNDGGKALIVSKAEVLVHLFVIHDAAAFPDHATPAKSLFTEL